MVVVIFHPNAPPAEENLGNIQAAVGHLGVNDPDVRSNRRRRRRKENMRVSLARHSTKLSACQTDGHMPILTR